VTPIDVAVLLDSTGSQSQHLREAKSIVKSAIGSLGGDGTFVAVAGSGDVPVFPFGVTNDRSYRLVQQSSSDIAAAQLVLDEFGAVEGGGDPSEGQLPAIMHLLTGTDLAGRSVPEAGGPQNVAFRQDARRVLVVSSDSPPHVATDTWCSEPGICTTYPGPSTEEVEAALDAQGVSLVSLARGDSGVLVSLSAATGGSTVAIADRVSAIVTATSAAPGAVVDATPIISTPSDSTPVSSSFDATATVLSVQTIAGSPADQLAAAILATPTVLRPKLGVCEGVTVTFEPAMARVKLGETAEFTASATAETGITPNQKPCLISLGNGLEESLSVTVAMPCPDPSTTTTTSPTVPEQSSTTLGASQSVPTIPTVPAGPIPEDPAPSSSSEPPTSVPAPPSTETSTTSPTSSSPNTVAPFVTVEQTTTQPPAVIVETPTQSAPPVTDTTTLYPTSIPNSVPETTSPATTPTTFDLESPPTVVSQTLPTEVSSSSTSPSSSVAPSITSSSNSVTSTSLAAQVENGPLTTVVESPVEIPATTSTIPVESEVATGPSTTSSLPANSSSSTAPTPAPSSSALVAPPKETVSSTIEEPTSTTTQVPQDCLPLMFTTSTLAAGITTSSTPSSTSTSQPTETTEPIAPERSSTTTTTAVPAIVPDSTTTTGLAPANQPTP
jgi:hypothetical protein